MKYEFRDGIDLSQYPLDEFTGEAGDCQFDALTNPICPAMLDTKSMKKEKSVADKEIWEWARSYLLKVTSMLVILVFLFILIGFLMNKIQISQRSYLFCETIKPDMSQSEIIGILSQYGKFSIVQSESAESIRLSLYSSDFWTTLRYSGRSIVLVFSKNNANSHLIAVAEYQLDDAYALCEY